MHLPPVRPLRLVPRVRDRLEIPQRLVQVAAPPRRERGQVSEVGGIELRQPPPGFHFALDIAAAGGLEVQQLVLLGGGQPAAFPFEDRRERVPQFGPATLARHRDRPEQGVREDDGVRVRRGEEEIDRRRPVAVQDRILPVPVQLERAKQRRSDEHPAVVERRSEHRIERRRQSAGGA